MGNKCYKLFIALYNLDLVKYSNYIKFSKVELKLININLKSSITKSLDNFIYILSILNTCFKEDKNVIKVGSAVVIKGVI